MLGAHKVHSLICQVYDLRNLRRAWEAVKKNKGSGGVDGVSIARFEQRADYYLEVLERKLRDGSYRPMPVRRVEIPKAGSTKTRPVGIPTVLDRVCQQAVREVLEPIFEAEFSEVSFGFRSKRSAHMAMNHIWADLQSNEWVVDADIASFFDTIPRESLLDAVATKVADGKVLGLIRLFLEAGVLHADGTIERTFAGTPQGGVISPLLANIYLHYFDEKMTQAGFRLTRYADDWLCVCESRHEAKRALTTARRVLEYELGLKLHPEKTHIVHITQGFEFLGFKVGKGRGLRHKSGGAGLYAIPSDKSVGRFKDRVRQITSRRRMIPVEVLIAELNPVLRGWGNYYRRANVRGLYNRLNRWVVMRIWSWKRKRWRNGGWRELPERRLYGQLGLVNLQQLIPSMKPYYRQKGFIR